MGKKLAVAALIGTLAMSSTVHADYATDLDVLSRIISAESGYCDWYMQVSVGSVVLNRVADPRFPNTIYDVVFQEGQYSPTINGCYWNEPTQTAIETAEWLLANGSQLDPSVVYQANFPQGTCIYDTISTSYSTMYFCCG